MVDSGSFRRAFSSFSSFSRLPSPFASQSGAPVGAPRQFGSTEHLSTEAIAAFVDGELRMSAHLRAAHHLSMCAECALEIDAQRQARTALRDSGARFRTSRMTLPRRSPRHTRVSCRPRWVVTRCGRIAAHVVNAGRVGR
ncbi:RNA polymerase sigma-70 factor [Mycobacteroides abscessus subsp. bolletii]|uniref:RNA polymerase subunit sigma-70 n=1 Tax=Mycobacteroides abscessus TaxID=36809 RepID=UPI0009D267E6|nr:RNA polymerase subunit sigma-70 [Mycobacteroides abscessus]SKO57619.1 RNA polymerase sigma-70 factor [Mycobacteroides abscessus subsp. bolletii]